MGTTRKDVVTLTSYQVLAGEEEYTIELPDGDCQVDYEVRATCPVTLYLEGFEVSIPWEVGTLLKNRIVVRGLDSLRIRPVDAETEIAVRVYHQPVVLEDPVDDKPCEVSVQVPVQLSLSDLINQTVHAKLAELRGDEGDEDDEADEIIDNLPDDMDPEFGPGRMDYEPPKPRNRRRSGSDHDGVRPGDATDKSPGSEAGDRAADRGQPDTPPVEA